MNDKERRDFLKSMGLPAGCLVDKKGSSPAKDNRIDKSSILALARKFDVAPTPKKPQTFEDYLKEKGE